MDFGSTGMIDGKEKENMRKNIRNKTTVCLLCVGLLAAVLTGCGGAEGEQKQEEQQGTQQANRQPADQQEGQDQTGQSETDGQSQEGRTEAEQQDPDSQSGQDQDMQQPTEGADGMEQDGGSQTAGSEMPADESTSIRVWGPILRVEDGNLVIDNRSDLSFRGEMILAVDRENTRILDGENGYPVEVSELNEEEAVFAYIEPTAALSEPPIVNASLILCRLPDDLRVPDYVRVTAMEEQTGGSYLLSGDNGIQYLVPGDCEILPFLTRNIVTLQDVVAGSGCLVWSDEQRAAQKIVLFAD